MRKLYTEEGVRSRIAEYDAEIEKYKIGDKTRLKLINDREWLVAWLRHHVKETV